MTRAPLTLLAALLPALAACASSRSHVATTAVPDETGRLAYDLPGEEPARAGAVQRVLDGAVCLLRTGSGRLCRRPTPMVCDTRTPAQVAALRELLRPAVERAAALELRTASAVDTAVAHRLPGARTAGVVVDARRSTPCADWGGGACAAFRYGGLWFLVTNDSASAGSAVQPSRVTLYTAGPVCRANPERR